MKKFLAYALSAVLLFTTVFTSFINAYGEAAGELRLSTEPDKWLTWNDSNNGPLSEEGAYLKGEKTEDGLKVWKKDGVSDGESVNAKYESESFSAEIDISKAKYFFYDLKIDCEEFVFVFFVGDKEIKLAKNSEGCDFVSTGDGNDYKGKIDLVQLLNDKGVDTSSGKVTISKVTIYVNGQPQKTAVIRELSFRDEEQAAAESFEFPLKADKWLTWNDRNDGPLSEDGAYLKGEEKDGTLIIQKKEGVSDGESVRGVYSGEAIELSISENKYLYYDLTIESSEFVIEFSIDGKNIKIANDADNKAFGAGTDNVHKGEIDFSKLLKDNEILGQNDIVTIDGITIYVNGPHSQPVTIREISIKNKSSEETPDPEPTQEPTKEPEPTATQEPQEPESESFVFSLKADKWLTWNDRNNGPLSEDGAYMIGEESGGSLIIRKKDGVAPEESVRGEYAEEKIKIKTSDFKYLFYDFELEAEEFAISLIVDGKEIKLAKDSETNDFENSGNKYEGKADFSKLLADAGVDTSKEELTIDKATLYVNGEPGKTVKLNWLEIGQVSSQNTGETPAVTGDTLVYSIFGLMLLLSAASIIILKNVKVKGKQ